MIVTTGSSCEWSITGAPSWISASGAAQRTGPGSVSLSYAANSGAARSGSITIAGLSFTISQAGGCAVSLSPTSQTIGASAGAGTAITVSVGAGCLWSASSGASWIMLGSPTSGSGAGQVAFSVAVNTGPQRQGSISVGTQSVMVIQQSGCTYTLDPVSVNVSKNGDKDVRIEIATSAACSWTAATPNDWITIKSATSGTGSGTVRLDVERNQGASRTGHVTIAGIAVAIRQQ